LNAVLLAAGYGTRLRALFPDTPKALIEIAGRPVLAHLLDNLARSGLVDGITIVTNDRYHAALQSYLDSHPPRPSTCLLSDGTGTEQDRLGALGDLEFALDHMDRSEDLLVTATDKLLTFELAAPLRWARRRAAPVNVCVQMSSRAHLAGRHGCVLLDSDTRIVHFEEKPRNPKSRLASLALYVLPAPVHPLLREYLRQGGDADAPGHFIGWLAQRVAVYGYVAPGPSYDVGTPATYVAAQRAFRAPDTEPDRTPSVP
jgi:glucose-1-phosphate thymidylyltransferase